MGSNKTGRDGPRLSQVDEVLIALYRAANATTNRVPYEELVIQAWKDFPESFSLRNYPEYPDASDIHKKLYSTLKRNGYVVSLGNKMFRLTEDGIQRAQLLDSSSNTQDTMPSEIEAQRLSRAEEAILRHAVRTRTFAAWQAGKSDSIVDHDARVFFQFSTSTPIDERKRRAKAATSAITKAAHIGISDSNELQSLCKFLRTKFHDLFD